MDRSLAEHGEHPQTAFIVGVAYICANTKLSRNRAEKALSYSLIDMFDNEDNPFIDVIQIIMIPWYKKWWWLFEAKFKR